LGNFNYKVFDIKGNTEDAKLLGLDLNFTKFLGYVYYSVFLLTNMVLLLNFVIAILSSTFARHDGIKLGLYYNVINQLFPVMEYNNKFGALVCMRPPLPLYAFVIPFLPFYLSVGPKMNQEFLENANNTICGILYLPMALIMTIYFIFVNLLMIPFAYLLNLYRVI
jgi:hypothetical protein